MPGESAIRIAGTVVFPRSLSGTRLAARKATAESRIACSDNLLGKTVPKIILDGYVIVAEAVPGEGGWMPSATIHDDRPDVDIDDVTVA